MRSTLQRHDQDNGARTRKGARIGLVAWIPTLALAIGLLAPQAQAFEAFDSRLQVHGFYQMQLRGVSKNWADQFDVTQWYNILNVELELEIAPDGFGPFDSVSAYVRAEVRFDCIYSRGCGMISAMNTYGDRSRDLPRRLNNARDVVAAGTINRFQQQAIAIRTDPNDPAATEATVTTSRTGQYTLPGSNPVPLSEAGPFKALAVSGVDGYRGTPPDLTSVYGPAAANILVPDDAYDFVMHQFHDWRLTAVGQKGGSGSGRPVDLLSPWLPKNFVLPNAALADKINPFDASRSSPQLRASAYNGAVGAAVGYAKGDVVPGDTSTYFESVLNTYLENPATCPGGSTLCLYDVKAQGQTASAAARGEGALPFRPIPVEAPGKIRDRDIVARGLFLPSRPLREAYANGSIQNSSFNNSFNISQIDRAFNRGESQSQTKELKEAYVDIETFDSRLWMRIGKQNIVWGKTELFRVIDQFNPQDYALASLPSLEESRIPLWAFRGVYSLYEVGPLDDVRIEMAFNFDENKGADLGACGEPYAPNPTCLLGVGALAHATFGIGVAGIERPPDPWESIKGWEAGIRIEFRYESFSFAISDFYGFEDLPYIDTIANHTRNVDPVSGRLRQIGATGSCLDGSEGACLTAGPTRVNDPNNAALLANPANALDAHAANQQFFAASCAATTGFLTLDPLGCSVGVFNSESWTVSPSDPNTAFSLAQTMSAGLAGGMLATNVLAAAVAIPIDPADPNHLPLVALNRDADDLTNTNNCLAPDHYGVLQDCGAGGGGFYSYARNADLGGLALGEVLSPTQEALLGCGPLMGTQCDNQGIDLLNTEASILFQSFVGFEGTANYWRSDDATRPQPGTVGFMTGEEQFIPTNLQPCSRYSYAISVTNCLGGPVATRFDANQNRTFVLPGARRIDNPDYEPAVFIDPSNPSIALGGDGCVNDRGGSGPAGYCTRSNVVNGTATGATELLHPYTNQPFASELAALSWNLMSILVSTDAAFDPTDARNPNECSFVSPWRCNGVAAIMGLAGLRRNVVRAAGNQEYGRRTFIWHGSGEVIARYAKRNVLGLSTDFAEDVTKTNWSVEFAWMGKRPATNNNSVSGRSDVEDYNLSISVDRPTFINFLNPHRTFFFNLQTFLQWRDGYNKAMPSTGPFNFVFTFFVTTGYLRDRLLPTFGIVYDAMGQSGAVLPSVTYRVTSAFSIAFGVAFFFGEDQYVPMGLSDIGVANRRGSHAYENSFQPGIGLIRDRDEVFLRLRYTF